MTLLNTANAIKLGASNASRVYLGGTKVWPKTVSAGYLATVLADNPAVLWSFGDAADTTAKDSSTHGIDATYTVATLGQPALVTTAGTCAKIGDRIIDPTLVFSPLPPSWTESGWFECATPDSMALCAFGNDYNYNTSSLYHGTVLVTGSGNALFVVYCPGIGYIVATGSTNVSTGRHYFAAEVDAAAGAINLYVDGLIDATASLRGGTPQSFDAYWHVGYAAHSTEGPLFNGKVQMFAAFGYALGATKVAAHWNAGK
jgi:hypothetical protein